MKFLVDTQLPNRLAQLLQAQGHDAIHTFDLADQNRTTDEAINDISIRDERVVITKDGDFVNSFLVARRPYKLLLVSTGNISNRDLEQLFVRNLPDLARGFESHDYIELSRDMVIFHL